VTPSHPGGPRPGASEAGRATLVLGPMLRHLGERDATIWVETSRPCTVEVRAGPVVARERTFEIDGHAFGLVALGGLPRSSAIPYEVRLDGEPAWPEAGSGYPPSLIRTSGGGRPFRLLFGSCRSTAAEPVDDPSGSGHDVLGAYAQRMVRQRPPDWPDALLMLGDQVYADETTPRTQAWLRERRDVGRPPFLQVADFEEYTRLYAESWSDPDVRWLLSTVPSSMIFDDHDVIDDWNTSRSWRTEMQAAPWWAERIVGALMSYWVYQHLGNLSPAQLGTDPWYRAVRDADDGGAILRSLARAADREADGGPGVMWSYRRDFGRTRLLVIDSRCGRALEEGARRMVGEQEFAWIEAQVEDGAYDHLLVGTSVPWLLPRALHDVEAADEALCAGTRGPALARLGEHLRRGVDLEHWAAFSDSFERLARLFARVGRGGHGARPPATICVLSGDVHHTYASEAIYAERLESRVYQLTCSPLHNGIATPMRRVFRAAWSRVARRVSMVVARACRAPAPSIEWQTVAGPFFGNCLGILELDGRAATFGLARSAPDGPSARATPVPEARRELSAARSDGGRGVEAA
jgi:hypothetical protein